MSNTKQIDDGGPAFPVQATVVGADRWPAEGEYRYIGMTLRDWFAGKALAGMLSGNREMPTDSAARYSYEIADAMLKARAAR
jgi:hypothetical protein